MLTIELHLFCIFGRSCREARAFAHPAPRRTYMPRNYPHKEAYEADGSGLDVLRLR